ncbi:MAG: glycosyltransferase family 4 protein [Hyphomicrobiaceae bacterium]|nr:glycosyltransferase family 4 protein [Hyphomicrobiaceae bacterium]
MRVLVDGFNLALEKGTGIATYARNLTSILGAQGHEVSVLYGLQSNAPAHEPLLREIAFFDDNPELIPAPLRRIAAIRDALPSPFSRVAHTVPMSGAVISRQFASRLPHYDRIHNAPRLFRQAPHHFRAFGRSVPVKLPVPIDIAHWTYPLPIQVKSARNIYTFHDLIPLRLPFTTLDNKRYHYKLSQHLAKSADHIVTVSETSRADIIELLGVPEDRVTNTYQAVDIPAKYLDVPIDVLTRELAGTFRLDYKKYLLFYGSIEPKKNIGRVIEAFLAADLDIPLVIVGAQAWKSEQELRLLVDDNIRSLIQNGPETHVRRKVVRLDYVSFPQLVNLIRGATAIAFPSLYEGFGLPVIEGLMCGTTVITANAHSTREIAGDAAILVDPYNVREIKDAITAAVSNSELRATLASKAQPVLDRFSQAAYRDRIRSLYERVMAQPPRPSSLWGGS